MKTRSLITILLSSVVVSAAFAAETAAPAAKPDASTQTKAKARPTLEKGMPAEAIIALIGKPAEVTPMNSPEGKAEKWIYNRVVDKRTVQTASNVQSIPTYQGFGGDGAPVIGTSLVPEYRLKYVVTTQVTSLLVFEGKLVVAKQWLEQTESYQ